VANGAGLRKKAFFKVYAMALYLPEKAGGCRRRVVGQGRQTHRHHLLRDLTASSSSMRCRKASPATIPKRNGRR
jgi:hypothetical protein